MNYDKNNIKNEKQNEFLKNEFSDELFNENNKVGYSPLVGGLVTRELVKKGEEIINNQKKS